MMITTTLTPIQFVQSTDENSVSYSKLAFQEAKIDYQILEQQIRNTPIEQFNLLVQLNKELAAVAVRMEAAFDAWSVELDRLLDVQIQPDPLPTPGLRLIDGWLHDSHGGRTLVLS
jgi:hypothetical protein